jgi:hypothetical protein
VSLRLVQVLVTKKCVLDGCHIFLCLKRREEDWNHVSDHSLATKARVMVLYTALSQVTRVWCITVTQKWKAIHLNIVT